MLVQYHAETSLVMPLPSFGVCPLSVIPVRSTPSDKSEMVTQLLFGEMFSIVERHQQWIQIVVAADGYMGWIDEKQFFPLSEADFHDIINSQDHAYTADLINRVEMMGRKIPVLWGSSLPMYEYGEGRLGNLDYRFYGNTQSNDNTAATSSDIIYHAQVFTNAPYLWGGRSLFGIDCSGFTQLVFKVSNIALKRDAYQQAEQGNLVEDFEDIRAGDLAFFARQDERISHVGIVLENGQIIHASGKVRTDLLDPSGILHSESGICTHRLVMVKRMF